MDIKFKTLNLKKEFDRGIINVGNLSRIRRVMKRAIVGETIKVGFIGGSITAGSVATVPENCYAYQVYLWWKNKFPLSTVEYLNAGIGATTSQFGVARVEQDLLKAEPDMVFAEFSVNDSDNDFYMETFEGLLRKILLYPSEPTLFMFNNVFYDDGHSAQRVHNLVGKYYDLPIVSVKDSIYEEIEKGTILNTEISSDNLHPNDFGHSLIAGLITNLLDRIYDIIFVHESEVEQYLVVSQPLTQNRYFCSERWNSINSQAKLEGFQKDDPIRYSDWNMLRYGWYAGSKGSSIRFEVEARKITIQYCKYAVHPAPIAKVMIDGNDKDVTFLDANFEETWGDCPYLQDIVAYDVIGKHTVDIIITDEVKDKNFYLVAIITA